MLTLVKKKVVVAVLITDKVDFRKRKLIRIKEGHYITINNLTFQDYIIVLNMFALTAAAKSLQSDSVRPHRRQPTRLPRPWDSPGKNTGVGCHLLLQCIKVKSESEVTQSCPTLSNPMDCSLPGSSVHGIFDKSTAVGCHCLLVLPRTVQFPNSKPRKHFLNQTKFSIKKYFYACDIIPMTFLHVIFLKFTFSFNLF